MMNEIKIIEIGLHWRDAFNLINGIGGWKQRYDLDIHYSQGMYDDSREQSNGGIIWRGPDFGIYLISTIEGTSVIYVQMDNNKLASVEAQKTWAILDFLFRPYPIDKPTKNNTALIKDPIDQKIWEIL